jgi:hypothetical protein
LEQKSCCDADTLTSAIFDHPNTRARAMRDTKTIATTPRKTMALYA